MKAHRMSRADVQRAFRFTHNVFLTLNAQLARAGVCIAAHLPRWRQLRDAWARFYSAGWSARRYEAMLAYRAAALRWRKLLLDSCSRLSSRELPLLALQ